jgi:predicted O-methyltransferase YrrM
MHSPFLFGLGQAWHRTRRPWREEHRPEVERLRARWRLEDQTFTYTDQGAGEIGQGPKVQHVIRVRDRLRKSTASAQQARELAALARWIGAERAVELGTNLGLTTAYLAGAGRRVWTVEGGEALANWAQGGWEELGLAGSIAGVRGTFESVVPGAAAGVATEPGGEGWDLVYIDGDHRGAALRRWVEVAAPALRANRGGDRPSVIVCDDIRWNREMWSAWSELAKSGRWDFVVDRGAYGVLVRHPGAHQGPVHVALRIG